MELTSVPSPSKREIRLATVADTTQIREIYYSAVTNKEVAISFEEKTPSIAEIKERIKKITETRPWLVYTVNEEILGYAYAGAHRSRWAYQWCVETSVYVKASAKRQGIGRGLYHALFTLLRLQGLINAYAGITLPNPASIAIHESMGFSPIGIYKSIGFKNGKSHDVQWWHLLLQPWPKNPKPPLSMDELRNHSAYITSLNSALSLIRT